MHNMLSFYAKVFMYKKGCWSVTVLLALHSTTIAFQILCIYIILQGTEQFGSFFHFGTIIITLVSYFLTVYSID